MTDTCSICFDTYSAKLRKKVTCQYCPAHACKGCQERYLLQSYEDPHCMECKRGWSTEFMVDNFPLAFRNDKLRKHRRKILFEREKSMLPAMQVFVEAKQLMAQYNAEYIPLKASADESQKIYMESYNAYDSVNRQLAVVRQVIMGLKQQRDMLADGHPGRAEIEQALTVQRVKREKLKKDLEAARKVYDEKRADWDRKMVAAQHKNHAYLQQLYIFEERVGAPTGEKRQFIMKCPADDCRGFLSSAYKCGTCSKWTCPDCLVCLGESKDGEHTCKTEEVESAKAIKAETRPCPKCGTRIFKIDGCDQMWCTMEGCGTAFSWNSGQIVTGRVHNPHYYEWLRRNGGAGGAPREAGDIPCGGMPTYWQLHQAFRASGVYGVDNTNTAKISEIHRYCQEIIDYQLPRHPSQMPRNTNKLVDVKYLMKEIDEAEWQRQLEISEARFNRKKEIGFIVSMFCTAMSDMFREAVTHITPYAPYNAAAFAEASSEWLRNTFVPNLEALRTFTNESLATLGKKQKMAVPQIDAKWHWNAPRILEKAAKKAAAAAGAAAVGEADDVPQLVDLTEEDGITA